MKYMYCTLYIHTKSLYFFFLMIRLPPTSTLTNTPFPYTTLFRSVASPATFALVLAVARFPFVFFFAAAIAVPVLFLVFAAPVAGFVFMRVRQAGARAGNQEAGHGRYGAETQTGRGAGGGRGWRCV